MKKIVLLSSFFLACPVLGANEIGLRSLLEEMVDRSRIAEFPQPEYVCMQASSYDRRMKTPGNADWFANEDWSNFLRVEQNDGRREWIMMDVAGPGAIVRWWITGFKFNGTIRVYLDGSSEPVLVGKADELIGGDLFLGPPLNAERSRGRNLYLPIPYAKRCKITYDGPSPRETKDFSDNLYYNINYREYPEGTTVKTFTRADFKATTPLIKQIQQRLLTPGKNRLEIRRSVKGGTVTLKPGDSTDRMIRQSGAIAYLSIRISGENLSQAMRSTVIRAEFDGRQTIWAPVGGFFGSGVGLNPFKGWWRTVDQDGWMRCYWPMPFQSGAKLSLTNYGKSDVTVEIDDIGVASWPWNGRTMYFHSSWRGENEINVYGSDQNRMEDWNYVTIQGKGVYVGDTLALFNRSPRWWGEGDEKVFVDQETFPSHIGTGTEDYFGYAWGNEERFESPFHAQPIGSGNQTVNHTTNTRVRLLDGIPFKTSLQFDMELWHWNVTTMDYATTTYWYAYENAVGNGQTEPAGVAQKVGQIINIVEGESLQLRRVSGGFTEVQRGDWGASGGEHLWWKHGAVGDELALAVPIGQSGDYQLMLQTVTAPDYGRVRILLDDVELSASEDFYTPQEVKLKRLWAGGRHLEKGEHILSFTILGRNPQAKPGNMLGIDYIELRKSD